MTQARGYVDVPYLKVVAELIEPVKQRSACSPAPLSSMWAAAQERIPLL
jgi:hypothetical protein